MLLVTLPACGRDTPAAPESGRRAATVDGPPIAPRRLLPRVAGPVGPQGPGFRWTRRLEGPVVPGPLPAPGGVVYAASNGGVLHAIGLTDGKDRWAFDGGGTYGSDLSISPLRTANGTVLWPGPRQRLFGIDATGRRLWTLDLGAQGLTPALTPNGDVIVATAAGALLRLTLRSRRAPLVRWRLMLGNTSYARPAIARDGSIYTTVDRELVAVSPRGTVRWRVGARDVSEVSPAIAPDQTITFGANDGVQYGVSPAGRVRWRHRLRALTYSSATAGPDGLIYVGDHHGFVTALSARSGTLVFRVLGLGRTRTRRSVGVWTAPAVDARHDVYFGTRTGHIYGFSPTGRKLLDIDTGATVDSNPALAPDGTLLIGSESGTLYAIR